MAQQISFTYNDRSYILEYTRSSVKQMERAGFDISTVGKKPMTMLPVLFAGAFLAHHPKIKQAVIDEIFERITSKTELMDKLSEMYGETLDSLLDEPEENEGNIMWEAK